MRLLHPLMPFISEELYQKLPAWSGKAESIVIAPYPTPNNWGLDFKAIDAEFAFVNEVAKTIRSLAASVNLPNNVKPTIYTITSSNADKEIIERNRGFILTLSKGGNVTFHITLLNVKVSIVSKKEDIPKGCVMDVSVNNTEVYLNVKDYIDIPKEVSYKKFYLIMNLD